MEDKSEKMQNALEELENIVGNMIEVEHYVIETPMITKGMIVGINITKKGNLLEIIDVSEEHYYVEINKIIRYREFIASEWIDPSQVAII